MMWKRICVCTNALLNDAILFFYTSRSTQRENLVCHSKPTNTLHTFGHYNSVIYSTQRAADLPATLCHLHLTPEGTSKLFKNPFSFNHRQEQETEIQGSIHILNS